MLFLVDDSLQILSTWFRKMTETQKEQLTSTIASGLSQAEISVQKRMLAHFTKADEA
jgi:catalase